MTSLPRFTVPAWKINKVAKVSMAFWYQYILLRFLTQPLSSGKKSPWDPENKNQNNPNTPSRTGSKKAEQSQDLRIPQCRHGILLLDSFSTLPSAKPPTISHCERVISNCKTLAERFRSNLKVLCILFKHGKEGERASELTSFRSSHLPFGAASQGNQSRSPWECRNTKTTNWDGREPWEKTQNLTSLTTSGTCSNEDSSSWSSMEVLGCTIPPWLLNIQ